MRGRGSNNQSMNQQLKERENILEKGCNRKYYCKQGNICPRLIFTPFALVVSGGIKDWANSNVFNYLSL